MSAVNQDPNIDGISSSESDVDVLIIGAGPAGLMAANALASAGIKVRIVEKRSERVIAGQADGMSPLSLDIFQSYGFADRLLREGNQMHVAAFYNPAPGGGIVRDGRSSDVTAPTARFQFQVTLHQGAIESIFHDSLRKSGVEIDRQVIPESINLSQDENALNSNDSYPVKVTLRHLILNDGKSGTEVVNAKYVLGADGAHSWTRRALGIPMEGIQTDYVWGVVDAIPLSTDFPDIRNRCAIHAPSGSVMVIPREGDIVRLYIQLSDEDAKEVIDAKGRIDRTSWGPQRLLEVAKKALQPYNISFSDDIHWWTLYIIGQRVASKFSVKERIFIAGDACHTHSPKAGQGMNTSMGDTHNLAWKILYVLRGWANRAILKTYEFERRKFAQDLIDFDKKFAALFSEKGRSEGNDSGVSHEEFLAAWKYFGGLTSGMGIHYAPSLITTTPSPGSSSIAESITIGMRILPQIVLRAADSRPFEMLDLLPADMRFKIIVFAGDIGTGIEQGNQVVNEQRRKVEVFANVFCGDDGILGRLAAWKSGGSLKLRMGTDRRWSTAFDVLTVLAEKKATVNFTRVPNEMVAHWSKIFMDDVDIKGVNGGKAYESYGLGPEGAVVVVRPDGYIGTVLRLEEVSALQEYFMGFML